MKSFFKLLALTALASALLVSCSSNSKILKKETATLTKLTEELDDVDNVKDLQKITEKAKKSVDRLPKEIQDMSEDELIEIEGGEAYLAAAADFAVATTKAAARITASAQEGFSDLLKGLTGDDDDD